MDSLPLADEVFLIGHDENSGKAHISDEALDTVLAGAVLGELLFAGLIALTEDTIVLPYSDASTGDAVCDSALVEINKQADRYPVRAWVEHLRGDIRPMVANRLIRLNLVERVEARGLLRTSIRYPFRDRIAAAAPIARLRYMLDHPDLLDDHSAALAALILAGNLEFVFGGASAREIRQSLVRMAQTCHPQVRLLIAGLESAVAALAMRAR
jgi:Golgi phosphoprotein 3 (GPP34).